jgi:RNA polymerase sigma factor (sigma-70 family)
VTPLLSTALLRTQSDERLLRLAAGGHDRAFEAIVERYRRPLLRYVRRLLRDGRAEDVVQAAFVSAWSSLRGGAEVRDLRPWLYRIAHNGTVNVLQRAGEPHHPLVDSLGGAAGPEIEVERRDDVRRALHGIAALPSRQRTALLAVAVEGRSHTEVAAELGLSDGALRQLVHRARTSVRAVATMLTPPPLAAAAAASHALGAEPIAAGAGAGAGGAGLAAASLKTGAVLLTAGALVTGAPRVAHVVSGHRPPAAGRVEAAQAAGPAAATTAEAQSAGALADASSAAASTSASPRRVTHGAAPAPKRSANNRGNHSGRRISGGGSSSGGGSGSGDDHPASGKSVEDRSGHDGSSSGSSGSGGSGSGSPTTKASDDQVVTASTAEPEPTATSGSGDAASPDSPANPDTRDAAPTSGGSSPASGPATRSENEVPAS